jgi:hypothetical protein
MFESLEDRQLMSVTLVNTTTTSVTDGTSNTVMTAEAVEKKTATPKPTQVYMTYTLTDCLISGYS